MGRLFVCPPSILAGPLVLWSWADNLQFQWIAFLGSLSPRFPCRNLFGDSCCGHIFRASLLSFYFFLVSLVPQFPGRLCLPVGHSLDPRCCPVFPVFVLPLHNPRVRMGNQAALVFFGFLPRSFPSWWLYKFPLLGNLSAVHFQKISEVGVRWWIVCSLSDRVLAFEFCTLIVLVYVHLSLNFTVVVDYGLSSCEGCAGVPKRATSDLCNTVSSWPGYLMVMVEPDVFTSADPSGMAS